MRLRTWMLAVFLGVGAAACSPAAERGGAPDPLAAPDILEGEGLPRVELGVVVSRYGRLEVVDGNRGDGDDRLTLNGRTLPTASVGQPAGRLTLEDAVAFGERDVVVVVLAQREINCRRPIFVELARGARVKAGPPLGDCSTSVVTALTEKGLTVQVDGRRCYDWNHGVAQRSCLPLTRADEQRPRQTPGFIDMGCRDPSFRIVAAQGRDSSQASLAVEHTPATARKHCEYLASYEGVTPTPSYLRTCVQNELAETPDTLRASADCKARTITDLVGDTYRYLGRTNSLVDAWINTETDEQLERPYCANNYGSVVEQFTAMCPKMSDFLLLDDEFKHGLR